MIVLDDPTSRWVCYMPDEWCSGMEADSVASVDGVALLTREHRYMVENYQWDGLRWCVKLVNMRPLFPGALFLTIPEDAGSFECQSITIEQAIKGYIDAEVTLYLATDRLHAALAACACSSYIEAAAIGCAYRPEAWQANTHA